MEGRCIFVFFMIFNAILGLTGLALLGGGIALAIVKPNTGSNVGNNAFIALIVIGAYITTILILGACSWKKNGVLIAYFVLILLLIIVEIVMIILVKVAESDYYKIPTGYRNESFDLSIKINIIVYAVSLGIAFLSFLFSTIYFCLMRKEGDPQLYSDVRKMEELNAVPQYQNL